MMNVTMLKRLTLTLSLGFISLVVAWLVLFLPMAPHTSTTQMEMLPVRFLDQTKTPIKQESFRILCYTTPLAGHSIADILGSTNNNGYLISSLPPGCNYLAAMYLLHEQPSGKPNHGPAYAVYATSWVAGEISPTLASGDIYLDTDSPLVLFNIVASLAWQPPQNSNYLATLQTGLKEASAYLYDLTDGQMAFGALTIHTDGEGWQGADMRFLAANDLRPTAHVGGIVTTTLAYTGLRATVYNPAAIYLGRYWDGNTAVTGTWAISTGSRTLVHEWAHYALFLYDEYQQTGVLSDTYCTCSQLDDNPGMCAPAGNLNLAASAMAFHYTASELWLDDNSNACMISDQWQVHGLSDWYTLGQWFKIQGLPDDLPGLKLPTPLQPGPFTLGLTGDLFASQPAYHLYLPLLQKSGDSLVPITDTLVDLPLDIYVADGFPLDASFVPHLYHLEAPGFEMPNRILHQGSVLQQPDPDNKLLGSVTYLGFDTPDRVRVFLDRYASNGNPGGRYKFIQPSLTSTLLLTNAEIVAVPDTWNASLDIQYQISGTALSTMTLYLSTPLGGRAPLAQICVMDASIGCPVSWQQTMTTTILSDTTKWQATFTPYPGFDELPSYFIVRVLSPEGEELVRWVKDGGGVGPAHDGGGAPLLDGPVSVKTVMTGTVVILPENIACNRVVVMPAANYSALDAAFSDVGLMGLTGVPLDIDILLSQQDETCNFGGPDHISSENLMLTLYYDQAMISRLPQPFDETTQLKLLRFNEQPTSLTTWSVVKGAIVNPDLNWIAVETNMDGLFAIGWTE